MNIYAIKIALRGVTPMIWRRLRLVGTTTIADFHCIIQIAMGWDDYFLHFFHIYGKDYGIGRSGCMSFSDNPQSVCLDDFEFDAGDRFAYTYNFYENWVCDIRVEAIDCNDKNTRCNAIPFCVGGKRRQLEDDEIDESDALYALIDKIVYPDETTTVGDIRRLIEEYDNCRFDQNTVNKLLKDTFIH